MIVARHIPQEDLVSYGLECLPSGESADIAAHLSECALCRAELARISGDLSLIAMSVKPGPLPEGARQRFLDRIAASSAARKHAGTSPVPVSPSASLRWVWEWALWGGLAAMVLLSGGLGIRLHFVVMELRRESAGAAAQSAENARARKVMELLTAPAAQHVLLTALETRPVPSARAIYLASRGALLMQAANLNPLAAGKTYELWIIPASGAPVPAGVFHPDAAGAASVVLPQIPEGVQAKAFGVTIENEGGSQTPTLPIILSGAAPSTAGE
jgi:hypothetical protein